MHTVINNPAALIERIPGIRKRKKLPKNNIRQILDRDIILNYMKKNKLFTDMFAKDRVSSFSAIAGNDGKISVVEAFRKKEGLPKYFVMSEFDAASGDLINKRMPDGTIVWTSRIGNDKAVKVYKNVHGIESIKIVRKGEPIYIIEKNSEVVNEYTKSAHLNRSLIKTSSSHYITSDKRGLEDSEGMYLALRVLENKVTLKDGREIVRTFGTDGGKLVVSNKNNEVIRTIIGNENTEKYVSKLPEEIQSALNAHVHY